MLKNQRREQFAELLASGKTAKDAYALGGYKAQRKQRGLAGAQRGN
jgi:hypothetical protein